MPDPNYWLKPIHARPGQPVSKDWLTENPWLLSLVGSAWPMRSIRAGDYVIYYAAGHQKIVAVARVTQDGGTETTRERTDLTGADYALEVKVRLALPRITPGIPDYYAIPGITHRQIEGGRPIELTPIQFLLGARALGGAAVPSNLDALARLAARKPEPISKEPVPRSASWQDQFPEATMACAFEGGAIYTADARGSFWLIIDEGTMADFLDEEDADMSLVSLEQYATRQERDIALSHRSSGRARGGA
jgi:hypothetical protein